VLADDSPASLTPKVFKKLLHIPTADKPLNLAEADMFLTSQEGGANIFREFILSSPNMLRNVQKLT
jgi:hypothetical protein